ncbi:thymopoietin b isoform X1 [Hemibagrus wyckioides]|uniref:thymopoietin b isoform X1 n=1 Tax=Hemibagrus wyckioides TaxID=337641 RepID=UPI00266D0CCE|nr:thymopoietin b isoform X1 [Hemibagrus wyckioides]XP_058264819.1 thymopoietin b isoform X1 [Hemibagrus wyckioides]
MADFLEDPSVLTKDKLKSELLANHVPLPTGEHRKDVYVQLYLKHLTALNKKHSPADTFSSDDEITPVISNRSRSGKKATKKTDKIRKEEVEVTSLTDSDLKDQLLKYGINTGPIVGSTRKLYEKRLQKLLDQTSSETTSPEPETAVPESVPVKADGSQNGKTHTVEDQYSDKEEDVEPEPVPVAPKPVRSRGKTPVTTRTSSRHSTKQVEETTAADEQSFTLDRSDILKDIFPNEPATPTGISATCRRPIHGAAGRPARPLDLWPEESLLQQRVFTTTKSSLSHIHSPASHAPSFSPQSELRPRRRSFSIWLKLLVFLMLAASLYYVFQNVSNEQIDSCLLFLQDRVITPFLTAIGVISQEEKSGSE